jgi:hypothetical protein
LGRRRKVDKRSEGEGERENKNSATKTQDIRIVSPLFASL